MRKNRLIIPALLTFLSMQGYAQELNDSITSGKPAKYSDEVVIAGLNEKVSCTSFSDELDYNNAVVKQAATNTYKFDVCILFNGLRRYDDGWKSKNVSVKVEWSNDGSTYKGNYSHNNCAGCARNNANKYNVVIFQNVIGCDLFACIKNNTLF